MYLGVGRRLVPLSTVAIACIPVGIVFAIAAFALTAYVQHVRRDAAALFALVVRGVGSMARPDAVGAGRSIVASLDDPAVALVFVDSAHRVVVLRNPQSAASERARIVVRPRADLSAVPQASGAAAPLTLGLATIFGLTTVRTRVGQVDISAQPNDAIVVSDIRAFFPAFLGAIAMAVLLAFAAARVLTREALRPLTEVTRALERFSAGDFTAEFITAEKDPQLGALAVAYNGAVEQVERAFAERAHAAASFRRFIADASHQFRTPLTVMRGFISILTKDTAPGDRERLHMLEVMGDQVALMSALVDRLALLERWEHEDPHALAVPTNLGTLVSDIVEPLALATRGRISIDSVADAFAVAQPRDLEHALVNVLDNAIKYTSGKIGIEVRAGETNVEIVVTDQGPGMNAEDLSRAFDRFYRGNRRDVAGTGLGLSIAERAAERAGGRITIHSDPSAGTQIRFTLPRCATPSGDATLSVRR